MDIPVFQPCLRGVVQALTDAIAMGWLGMGATTKTFEDAIADYLERTRGQVVCTNTGTSALHLACELLNLQEGDEVIVPSFNYVADHHAILSAGGTVVFCDISDDDLGMDPDKLHDIISPRTRALMPLHFAGKPCRIDEIREFARQHRLRVIEDATHALGTSIRGKKIGYAGDITCFSFDPVKIITSIDGGALAIQNPEEIERAQRMRLLGVDRDTMERYKNSRAWEYDVVCRGFRYHLTNVNASVGLSQLSRIDEFIRTRSEACSIYHQRLAKIDGLRVTCSSFEGISPFIYTVRVLNNRRMDLIRHLREHGIGTGIHFLPAHEYHYFRGCRRGDLSATERVSREILTLPLHSHMDPNLVHRICDAVAKYFIA